MVDSSTELTLVGAGVPSGSRAGVAVELWPANTPGPGSDRGDPPAKRRRARSRWLSLGTALCLRVSTVAPSAAVISSAAVSSKANR